MPNYLYTLYSKTCLKRSLKKKIKIGFRDILSLNAGQMIPLEHSAILTTFIKLPSVIKAFVLSIFEWPLKTGFSTGIHCTVKHVLSGHPKRRQK